MIDPTQSNEDKKQEKEFPGYPAYPKSEDIYAHDKKEQSIDPESPTSIKADPAFLGENERNPEGEYSADDLDIPGAELDDADEAIGREDEENNYYSLGGDNHEDLEEDQATGLD